VYKNLFYRETLEPTNYSDSYYTIKDLFDFVTGENTKTKDYHHLKHKLNNFYDGYNNNIEYISNIGLPSSKLEQFNFSNIHKLYNKEILWSNEPSQKSYLADLEPFEQVAFKKNTILFNDGMVYPSNDLGVRKPFQLQILDQINVNRNKQDEYVKLVKQSENFSNITYAFSPFLNTIIVPSGANSNFKKNPIHINYVNKNSQGILECNTNIVDIQHKAKVHIKENVKLQSGQMNNIIYIVRENCELVLDRVTNDFGGFGVFDSKFICHPNSKVTINFKNTGSEYYQENFYFDLTTNVDLSLNGRNNIYKGHEYHQFVHVDSKSLDNKSIIDIKNVGNENASTSFIGRFDVSPNSVGFNGHMKNENLMLTPNTKMHSRPILDIHTKEIECTHGCTISNIDKSKLYYLQSRGLSKDIAEDVLVSSFLC